MISTFLLSFLLITGRTSGSSVISLYNDDDNVLSLTKDILGQTFQDDHVKLMKPMVIQFYSHWCGYCKHMKPIWTHLAEVLQDKNVTIAAVNCATEDVCTDFLVPMSPTIRVFKDGMGLENGFAGIDVPVELNVEVLLHAILAEIDDIKVETDAVTPPDSKVYAVDIEKMIQYSIFNEIPLHNQLLKEEISVIVEWIDAVLTFVPLLNNEVTEFLETLHSRLKGKEFITKESYMDLIHEADSAFGPFLNTPDDWIGCKGSDPTFRGYPCSTWTTYHTMFVAAFGDTNALQTVKNAVVNFVETFCSCGHCAQVFHADETVEGRITGLTDELWLWAIHNRVNQRIKGDVYTEDPSHPKILWPSKEHCPECRTVDGVLFGGVAWDVQNVVAYMKKVYGEENIVPHMRK